MLLGDISEVCWGVTFLTFGSKGEGELSFKSVEERFLTLLRFT